jgi:hypothetical protein
MAQIPFDFGQWREPAGRICPQHGSIDGGLAVRVEARKDQPPIIRQYCALCVIDALDAACISFGDDRGFA